MEIFTKILGDGSYLETFSSYFDPALASNFKVDHEEKIVMFDYDAAECGNSLNLPCSVKVTSVKFLVKVTPYGTHTSILATYDIDGTSIKKFADDCGVIEYSVRFDDGIDRDEQAFLYCYIINNLLNK